MTKDEVDAVLASATDLANSWARELGVSEARNELDLGQLIDRLWAKTSTDYFNLADGITETVARARRRRRGIPGPEAFK